MKFRLFLAVAFAAALTACAGLGLYTPQNFTERALAAQLTVTSVRQSATQLLNVGSITVADAKNAQDAANTANQGIDLALGFYKAACPTAAPDCIAPTADAKLTAVVGILQLTQTYLRSKGPK